MKCRQTNNINLFVYGTLLFDSIWDYVVGRNVQKQSACLKGWTRLYLIGKQYPGIRVESKNNVEGLLMMGLTRRDMEKLDQFEDPIYTKKLLDVVLKSHEIVEAYTYVVEEDQYHKVSDKVWNPGEFERYELKTFMEKIKRNR